MIAKLKALASIQLGYSFRSQICQTSDGAIAVMQLGDLSGKSKFLTNFSSVWISKENLKAKNYIQKNDLIFCPRGELNSAWMVSEAVAATIIAAPLVCIRITDSTLLPEYLCWFINHPQTQAWFASHAQGTLVKMIDKPTLENLDLPVPSLKVQTNIASYYKLAEHEKDLSCQLAKLKEHSFQSNLMQILMKNIKGNTNAKFN